MSGEFFDEEFSAGCEKCNGTGREWATESSYAPCSECAERAWEMQVDRAFQAWKERDL